MSFETLHAVETETPEDDSGMAVAAIREALAILDAIGQGGLFESVPRSESDRRRHATGTALLELLETRLRQGLGGAASVSENGKCRRPYPTGL